MKNCPETKNLLDRALEREAPREISAQDQQHLEQCEACRQKFAQIIALEANLKSLPREVENHMAAKPIQLEDVTGPVRAQTSPRTIAMLGLIALAVLFWLVSPRFMNSEKEDMPAEINKEKPVINLPGNFIVQNHLNLKQGNDSSYSTDQAYITRDDNVIMRFTRAEFTFVPSGIELNAGKVEVEIAGKGLDFSITTFNAVISVKGTIFAVEVRDDKSSIVSVSRGKVEVINISGDKTFLTAGESSIISPDGTIQKAGVKPAAIETINTNLKGKEETASAQQMLNE